MVSFFPTVINSSTYTTGVIFPNKPHGCSTQTPLPNDAHVHFIVVLSDIRSGNTQLQRYHISRVRYSRGRSPLAICGIACRRGRHGAPYHKDNEAKPPYAYFSI